MQNLDPNDLVRTHAKLVASVARQYVRPGIAQEDLEQEGFIGLMIAVERFDPTRGATFVTFAWWHIRDQINAHVRREFRQTHGLIPGKDKKQRAATESLNELVATAGDAQMDRTEKIDRLVSDDPSPEQLTIYRELLEATADAVRTASGTDKRIAAIAKNRLSSQPKKHRTVARRMGVSRQRVTQLEAAMLKKLREML